MPRGPKNFATPSGPSANPQTLSTPATMTDADERVALTTVHLADKTTKTTCRMSKAAGDDTFDGYTASPKAFPGSALLRDDTVPLGETRASLEPSPTQTLP